MVDHSLVSHATTASELSAVPASRWGIVVHDDRDRPLISVAAFDEESEAETFAALNYSGYGYSVVPHSTVLALPRAGGSGR